MTSITICTPWRDHLELAGDYFAAVGDTSAERLIIVDDGSRPPLPCAQARFETSRGFSAACNLGLAEADTDAVLFLNNDIALTRADWLDVIRNALEPGVLVGAQLRYDRHGEVDGRPLPYLDGWCLAGMRDDLLELGGFDETLEEPAYYSDNLLCLEARAAGMTLREARVGLTHKCGVTSQPTTNPRVQEATLANRERYAERARELFDQARPEAVGATYAKGVI
jgi:GT2 family glycosyltransferase